MFFFSRQSDCLHKKPGKAGNDVINILKISKYAIRYPDVVSYEFYKWPVFQKDTHVYIINIT